MTDIMPCGRTVNSDLHIQTHKTLSIISGEFDLTKIFIKFSFSMTKQCPPTSLKIQEAIAELGWNILPQPPYSPHLGHSGFHLSGALKDVIQWQRFGMYDNVTEETSGCEYRFKLVQDGERRSCFLLAQGCGSWKLCRKMRRVIHPST